MPPSGLAEMLPLIGRDEELQAFHTAAQRLAAGAAQVMQISGELGIGRTRLLQEFAGLIGEQHHGWLLTRSCRADETPLGPLVQARSNGRLEAFQHQISQVSERRDHFGELIGLLARLSEDTPLWLLLDDLHTADEATQAFAERLVAAVHHGALHQQRVGVVLSLVEPASPALTDRLRAQDMGGVTNHLTLAGLSPEQVIRWLDNRLPVPADAAVAKLLANASGGNPLLLTELTLYLQRSGMLSQVDGRLTLQPDDGVPAEAISLPEDLTTLLRSKISSISGDCRRAMTLAAFLGSEFDMAALADMLKRDAAEITPLIEEAVSASLVEWRTDSVAGFKHSSARELFYRSPDQQGREATHLKVCEGLISEFGETADDHCLTITHHLIRAGSNADPEVVLHFASRAADVAFRHHSYYLAGRYYEAAAHAGQAMLPPERCATLHCQAGEAFQRWSDVDRSTACFQEAVRLYENCDDLIGYARALQGLLRNQIAFGETESQEPTVATELQNLIGSIPESEDELRVRLHDTLAGYYHNIARYDVAESYAQTAMAVAARSDDPTLRCIPVTSLALAQMEQLRLTDAKTTWLEGLSFDRAAGAVRYEGLHLQRLPVALYCMGEIQEASRYSQTSYRHNRAIGNTGELCLNITVDLMIANLRGDFANAIDIGQEGMELMAVTRYLWSAPSLIAGLAYALTMVRRFDEADAVIAHLSTNGLTFDDTGRYRSTARRLEQLLGAHRNGGVNANDPAGAAPGAQSLRGVRMGSLARLCNEAELALLQNRPERLTGVHDALEFVHRRGLSLALGWCCSIPRCLAVSTALRNGMARAEPLFDEALRVAERAHAPLEHARVELYRGLAALISDGGSIAAAQADLTSALTCFDRLAAPSLTRLAEKGLARSASLPNP